MLGRNLGKKEASHKCFVPPPLCFVSHVFLFAPPPRPRRSFGAACIEDDNIDVVKSCFDQVGRGNIKSL